MLKKQKCICPNTGCPAYGDCKQCTDYHKGNPYYTSEETKVLVESMIKKYGVMKK